MLASLSDLLATATEKAYALVIASVDDLLAAQALIVQAAAQQAPLVLALPTERLHGLTAGEARRLADALREQARMAPTPICLMLSGVQTLAQVEQAIHLGFSAILIENTESELIQRSVELTRENGMAVVALLAQAEGTVSLPDPAPTHALVESTGVEALLLALGEALPFDHLIALCERLPVPLLLRMGATLSENDFRRALALGVRAFDCSAMLAEALAAALREYVNTPDFEASTLVRQRDSVLREALSACLKLTESAGRTPYQPIDIPSYAQQLFAQGYSCAESVFTAFAEVEGYSSEVAHRAATSFVGGMAGQGLTCGALTGGLMVIGAREAHSNARHKPPRYAARAMAAELVRWYQAQKGTTNCRELLQLDLSDPEQAKQYSRERHLYGICIPLVREVSEWLIARFRRSDEKSET